MKEKTVTEKRRKYCAAFKEEVLQMVFNGHPVSRVARSLGIIGENLIYRSTSDILLLLIQKIRQGNRMQVYGFKYT
ncbi:hypothetical protein GCM10023188_15610 [Pontibacter saemangeumensis]|uniref:Transposase n=1 Tax=Pontibacter saemangeumensis TaxID=1084525 RepID=A0ABP8LIP3_9BACT